MVKQTNSKDLERIEKHAVFWSQSSISVTAEDGKEFCRVIDNLREARADNARLQRDVDSRDKILEQCLRVIDRADGGRRPKMAAGVVPCLLYGALPDEFERLRGLAIDRDHWRKEALDFRAAEAAKGDE